MSPKPPPLSLSATGPSSPCAPGDPVHHHTPLDNIELHLFFSGEEPVAELEYIADDGLTFAYRRGGRSRLLVQANTCDNRIHIEARLLESGSGPIRACFVVHGPFTGIRLNGSAVPTAPHVAHLAGCSLEGSATAPISFS